LYISDLGKNGVHMPTKIRVIVSLVKTGAMKIGTRFRNAKN